MEYSVDMDQDVKIYTPSFIKIGSSIQKFMRWGDTQIHRQHGDHISIISFFENNEMC
jgi:hypothetical protein